MLWVQSPELARRMALAFDDIAADLYWIRAVVLYGGERRAPGQPIVGNPAERLSLLYPLLDMTTTLDPNFDVAARLGAIFLSEGVSWRARAGPTSGSPCSRRAGGMLPIAGSTRTTSASCTTGG